MRSFTLGSFLFLALNVPALFAGNPDLVVHRHVTAGPMDVNCYLLYDPQSKEAAVFDAGGAIDSLLSIIREKHLSLKYIFLTHAHADHIAGIPSVQKQFPRAKVCVSQEEINDSRKYLQWRTALHPEEVEEMKADSATVALLDFDFRKNVRTDILVKNGSRFPLGNFLVRAIRAPGHSRGSICYAVGNLLFSGDVLFRRRVGRSDLKGSGGWETLVKSVRHLYATLPDETIVYPGHGPSTDIGSEKRENLRIRDTERNK